jgi:hypothetical protein
MFSWLTPFHWQIDLAKPFRRAAAGIMLVRHAKRRQHQQGYNNRQHASVHGSLRMSGFEPVMLNDCEIGRLALQSDRRASPKG